MDKAFTHQKPAPLRIIFTGGSGFVGTYLKQLASSFFLSKEVEILDLADPAGPVDITDSKRVAKALSNLKPDAVIHLAAQSHIPSSFENPENTLNVNFLGTHNIIQGLKAINFRGRLLFVSSAHVYGFIEEKNLPGTENEPKKPESPYGLSKLCAEELCLQEVRSSNLDVVIVRPFNQVGPGQSTLFVLSSFSKQVIEAQMGLRSTIETGDLNISRDFLDVRDAAPAYFDLLEKGRSGRAYNLCSGKEYKLSYILEQMMHLAKVNVPIKNVSAQKRPSNQQRLIGSYELLKQDTGWEPSIPLENTLQSLLDDWSYRLCQKNALL